jgi:hypothetical protein
MRLTIITVDGFVSVNGEGYHGIDLSFMPADIHAVQWYATEGEVEYRGPRGRAIRNELITDITAFEPALAAWREAKSTAAREKAEREQAEQERIEREQAARAAQEQAAVEYIEDAPEYSQTPSAE